MANDHSHVWEFPAGVCQKCGVPAPNDRPAGPQTPTWAERILAMEADAPFMRWLAAYLPGYNTEYSGNLLGMYDAWRTGRSSTLREVREMAEEQERHKLYVQQTTERGLHAYMAVDDDNPGEWISVKWLLAGLAKMEGQ